MMCHYIPIAVCMLYPSLLYFILIFLYPCEPVYDFTQLLCVIPCYFFSSGIANFDTFFNNWAPIFAIPVLSGTLFARFLVKKRQMRNEAFRWKRDRKMVIQLLTITSLYLFMWSPVQAATVYDYVWTAGLPSQFEVDYLYSLPYFIHLLYPFVIFFSNSEVRWRPRNVAPQETHQLRRTQTLVTHWHFFEAVDCTYACLGITYVGALAYLCCRFYTSSPLKHLPCSSLISRIHCCRDLFLTIREQVCFSVLSIWSLQEMCQSNCP